MPTRRETILNALFTMLQGAGGATVLREDVLPERVPASGLVILRDGNPGSPEVTLSPARYHYEHRVDVEVIVQNKAPAVRASAFDNLTAAIGAALNADRTLGGLCDWLEAAAPEPVDMPIEGAVALKAAIIQITLIYTTTDPLA